MTLQTLIKQVGTRLNETLGTAVYHYRRPKGQQFPFCVWQETGEARSFVTAGKREQAITFTVDYYTKTEYDSNCDLIQDALDSLTKSWTLTSVDYDVEIEATHYEWELQLAWQSVR